MGSGETAELMEHMFCMSARGLNPSTTRLPEHLGKWPPPVASLLSATECVPPNKRVYWESSQIVNICYQLFCITHQF